MTGRHAVAVDGGTRTDSVLDLLDLEQIEPTVWRSTFLFEDRWALYGGQVAAQALHAAGRTVDPGRVPHSLHAYFLRPGDAASPVLFRVVQDRDGGSFSSRRVEALQNGLTIFTMAASFHAAAAGADATLPDVEPTIAAVPGPDESEPYDIPRLLSFEGRLVPQFRGGLDYPARFWARCTEDLGDSALIHACVATYLSDISSGTGHFNDGRDASSSSLDHAVWFHRAARADDWMLMDLVPRTVAGGRGYYDGTLHDEGRRLIGSIAQETLFRSPRR